MTTPVLVGSIYWYRRRVPDDLRRIFGKTELKFSLCTKNLSQAKRACERHDDEVDERFQALRAGLVSLTDRQVASVAGEVHRRILREEDKDKSGIFDMHRWTWMSIMHADVQEGTFLADSLDRGRQSRIAAMEEAVGSRLRDILSGAGINPAEETWQRLLFAANRAAAHAYGRLASQVRGDYGTDAAQPSYPAFSEAELRMAGEKGRRPLSRLFEEYAGKRGLAERTVKRYTPVIADFEDWIGSGDLMDLTRKDVRSWRDHLLKRLDPVTVRDVYVAALRMLYGWLKKEKDWPDNPFSGLTVVVRRTRKVRQKSFKTGEVDLILSSASKALARTEDPVLGFALRWVPWICAYTGARVAEVVGLREGCVFREDGFWVFLFSETKELAARTVPVHPHLVEQGLIDALQARNRSYFFIDPDTPPGSARDAVDSMVRRIGSWVRKIGVDDPHVQPNHAWRHRMRTILRRKAGREERDAILGHRPDAAGADYGEFEIPVLAAVIGDLPWIRLDGPKPEIAS